MVQSVLQTHDGSALLCVVSMFWLLCKQRRAQAASLNECGQLPCKVRACVIKHLVRGAVSAPNMMLLHGERVLTSSSVAAVLAPCCYYVEVVKHCYAMKCIWSNGSSSLLCPGRN